MSSTRLSLIVLCGVVGSGKTHLSKAICKEIPGWKRISQDDLGSRPACEVATERALKDGFNVIIDRCNFDPQQRKKWIDIGLRFHATLYAIELKTPIVLCRQRILQRQDHPTGVTGQHGSQILDGFIKDYKSPSAMEKFERIYAVDTSSLDMTVDSLTNLLEKVGIAATQGV